MRRISAFRSWNFRLNGHAQCLKVVDTFRLGVNKNLRHLPYLRTLADHVNHRLLETERISQNCALSQEALDRVQRPTVEGPQRTPGLRFGDARVMALLHALCSFQHLHHGFRHRDLRQRITDLLGLPLDAYTPGRMTYDLRRLRLKGLIARIEGTNRYLVTTYGLRVAFFYTKVYLRILRPGWAALVPPDTIPRPLRHAFEQLDAEIHKICDDARLRAAG